LDFFIQKLPQSAPAKPNRESLTKFGPVSGVQVTLKAVSKRTVSPESMRTLKALLYEPGATSIPVLTNQVICEAGFRILHQRLVSLVEDDPEVEVGFITFIDADGETSHAKTEIELFHSQKKVQTTLRAMSPNFFGITELALFNSQGHPSGGQRVQRHEHALIVGPDVHRQAAEIAAKHAKWYKRSFTGAKVIDVKKVATDKVNLARMAAYLFKPPYQCMNWCPGKDGKDGHMNHSEKGDRFSRYLRLAQLRSMMSVEQVTFGGGEGQRIRSDMIKFLRALALKDAAGGKQVLHPDAISSFWVDFTKEIRAEGWNLPIIKTCK